MPRRSRRDRPTLPDNFQQKPYDISTQIEHALMQKIMDNTATAESHPELRN